MTEISFTVFNYISFSVTKTMSNIYLAPRNLAMEIVVVGLFNAHEDDATALSSMVPHDPSQVERGAVSVPVASAL